MKRYQVRGLVFYTDPQSHRTYTIPAGTHVEVSAGRDAILLRWMSSEGRVREQQISAALWATYVSGQMQPL